LGGVARLAARTLRLLAAAHLMTPLVILPPAALWLLPAAGVCGAA
jgi:hypothetical protein